MVSKELLPFLLPVIRRDPSSPGRVFAVTADGVLVGSNPRGSSHISLETEDAVERLVRSGHKSGSLATFRFVDISKIAVNPVDCSSDTFIEISTHTGSVWRGKVPVSVGSLPLEAAARAWGHHLALRPTPPSVRRWVYRVGTVVVSILGGLGCLSVIVGAEEKVAALPLLVLFLLLVAIGVLAWKPKPRIPRGSSLGSKPAHAAPDDPSAATAKTTSTRSRSSPNLGRVFRIVGAGSIIAAFMLNGVIANWLYASFQSIAGAIPMLTWVTWVALALPGLWLVVRGYVLSQPDGPTTLAKDSRPPILFLRSFGHDNRFTYTEESTVARMCGLFTPKDIAPGNTVLRHIGNPFQIQSTLRLPLRIAALVLGRGSDTAEEQLARALSAVGPVVAVGDPSQPFPSPGAARLYFTHDEWRANVADLASRCALVILQPGDTDGVWWEIRHAVETLSPHKVIVSLRSLNSEDLRDNALARLAQIIGHRVPDSDRQATFLAFDTHWKPQPIREVPLPPILWPWRGTSIDLRKTLHSVIARLSAPSVPPRDPSCDANDSIRRDLRYTPSRLHRVSAAALYGVAPFGLLFAAIFSPMIFNLWVPSLAGVDKSVSGTGYRMQLDSAWTFKGHPANYPTTDLYSLGLGHTLIVGSEIRGTDQTLRVMTDDSFVKTASDTVLGTGSSKIVTPAQTQVFAGWPWRVCTVDVHSRDNNVQSRVHMFLLEASHRRFVVIHVQQHVSAGITAGDDARWSVEVHRSVRDAVETFVPTESIIDTSRLNVLTRLQIKGKTGSFVFQTAADWSAGQLLYPNYDYTLMLGENSAFTIGELGAPGLADPFVLVPLTIQAQDKAQPDWTCSIISAGWLQIDGRTFLGIRKSIKRPNQPDLETESLTLMQGSKAIESMFESIEQNEELRSRALLDARAMMASVRRP